MMMNEYELPLYELFTRLRQADMPLGIDEYLALLQALRAGFGIESREALAQLCRMLWIKSDEDERLFSRHFEQIMPRKSSLELPSTTHSSSPRKEASLSTSQSVTLSHSPAMSSGATVEKRAAKAVLHTAGEDEIPYSRFVRSDEYFPVTRRQMKQGWRYLRRPFKERGAPLEIDVNATLDEIGRTGQLLDFMWLPRQKNRAELLLLIDQGGSMVPFHVLSRRLAETAQHGGRLGRTDVYFFHNCPTTHLYRTPTFRDAVAIREVLNSLSDERTSVLIFSDAGTARRGFHQTRLKMTKKFLKEISSHFRSVVWLNPTPRARWAGTTAGEIQEIVAMFEANRRGLDNAISFLRGHSAVLTHHRVQME